MRSLSLDFRAAINAQESGEVPIFLLTIAHDDFDGPMRLSTNPTTRVSENPLLYSTTSRGEDYFFLPMEVVLPDENEEGAPRSVLRISNVTREMVALTRSVTTPAKAKLELVLASALDEVEVESPWMDILSSDGGATEIQIELSLDSMSSEPYPAGSFDPASFPGMF